MIEFQVEFKKRTVTKTEDDEKYKLVFKGDFQAAETRELGVGLSQTMVDVKLEFTIHHEKTHEYISNLLNIKEFGDLLPVVLRMNSQSRLEDFQEEKEEEE